MNTFKQYIKEGGNVKIGETSAQPILVSKQNRNTVTNDIKTMLHSVHDSFYKDHGGHLFGKDKKALLTGSAYAGSTKHLFNHSISDDEFVMHKKSVGDVDVQVPAEHMDNLKSHLSTGRKFGKYTVVGVKHSGSEHHALMQHDDGSVHQIDFEKTHYEKNEPSKFDQLSHSSDWHDTKIGVKGMHRRLLLNAIGGTKYKFSLTLGLGSREKEGEWNKNLQKINHTLFGQKANIDNLSSFHGLINSIKKHIPSDRHQEIFDKFAADTTRYKNVDHKVALKHLASSLHVKHNMNESVEVHHTSVIPLTGFSPFSHMGHAKDLGSTLHSLPGTKHVGISSKSEHFSDEERVNITKKQWQQKDNNFHVVHSAGETIARAHASLPSTGKKVLHLLVGHDRKGFAEGLKSSLDAGKIKEMGHHKFDEIHIHYPKDVDRSHGMSGTNMRQAAHESNLPEFHRHLGHMFSTAEAKSLMKKTQDGIAAGSIKLKRSSTPKKTIAKEDVTPIKMFKEYLNEANNEQGWKEGIYKNAKHN